jgi:hypothetical protein
LPIQRFFLIKNLLKINKEKHGLFNKIKNKKVEIGNENATFKKNI